MALYKKALQKLDLGESEAALKLGERLKKLRYSGAFEVLALAYNALERTDEAIAVLEEGTRLAPQVSLLWHFLGNTYSDARRYADAHAAYAKAEGCPGIDKSSLDFNRAVCLSREGRAEEALLILRSLAKSSMAVPAAAFEVDVLLGLGRASEALAVGLAALPASEEAPEEAPGTSLRQRQREWRARFFASVAKATWIAKGDAHQAREHAMASLRVKSNSSAFDVIREIRGSSSPKARRLRLLVLGRGHWPGIGEILFRNFEVIADDASEALELIRDLEKEISVKSLEIDEVTDLGPAEGELKGVLWATGHVFGPDE